MGESKFAFITITKWKQRLHSAVTHGASVFRIAQIQVDSGCDFGKWFYGLPAALQATEPGRTIQHLHASFHIEAARILLLALNGQAAEVEPALAPDALYARLSGQLTSALTEWKQTIGN